MNDNEESAAKTPPDGPPVIFDTSQGLPPNLEFHPDFGDRESMWNMRKWLQAAIEKAGAVQTGAGMGMGTADIDFTLEGHNFNVVIKPR